jgi:predicted nucleotidyltransferase
MEVTPAQTARTLIKRCEERLRRHERAMDDAREALGRTLPAALERHGGHRAWLFGSLAWGETHDESDIDLAVEGLPAGKQTALHVELMGVLPLRVDLLRLEELPESFRERILTEGRLLYEAPP